MIHQNCGKILRKEKLHVPFFLVGWVYARGDVFPRALRAIGDVGRQGEEGEGGYPDKQKIGKASFMDGPLD